MGWRKITIVTGGQTGVDRAALEAALCLSLPVGGWCPRGRLAEDGCVPLVFPLKETPLPETAQRTLWNVRDSDGTVILMGARKPRGGTLFTAQCARRLKRPLLCLPLLPAIKSAGDGRLGRLHTFILQHRVAVVNVAGPRESEEPGITELARAFLLEALRPFSGYGDV